MISIEKEKTKGYAICPLCEELHITDCDNDYMLSMICSSCGIKFNYKTEIPLTNISLSKTDNELN